MTLQREVRVSGWRGFTTAVLIASVATVVAAGLVPGSPVSRSAAVTPSYYVALGASLAAGADASPISDDYVNLIAAHEQSRYPGLITENLSCGGATTTEFINGPGCGPGTQLGNAEAFLRAHPGQVPLVTIDIGADEYLGCFSAAGINMPCVNAALAADEVNMPVILDGLKSAYPGIRVFGMDYYDPFLASWLDGTAGQALARQSLTVLEGLDSELRSAYSAAGFPMADPFSTFRTDDFRLTGSYDGQKLPENVATICNWTNMCLAGDVHTNDTGYAKLAGTFEPLIDASITAPLSVLTTSLPAATVGRAYTATLQATGGVTPYRWKRIGSLPPGLHLASATGSITGTPSRHDVGSYSFEVEVTDAAKPKVSATTPLSITVS